MSLNAGNVLKINITTDPKDTVLEYVQKYLNKEVKISEKSTKNDIKPLVIVTPNPEQIVLANENPHFAKILNRADISLPDGVGVVIAMRFFAMNAYGSSIGAPLHRIAGVDFMKDLVDFANKESVTIGLMGGRAGLAVKAYECLRGKHLKLKGWGQDVPEVYVDNDELRIKNYDQKMTNEYFRTLAGRLQKEKVGILFVGLGAPKQEYFVQSLLSHLQPSSTPLVLMSVGGSFDLITDTVKRAPHFIRLIGFEWAWRLFQEPWRWKRQVALVKFSWMVISSIFSK